MIFIGSINWLYYYITAGVYLNGFSNLSLKCRDQVHALKPQTAFEAVTVFESQKNWGYKPKENGVTQPTYPCGATRPGRHQLWRKLSVKDDCKWRPLIKRVADDISWTDCPSLNDITPLFREGCVCCPALARPRGNFASKVRGWVGELKHFSTARREDGWTARRQDGRTARQGTVQLGEAVREHLREKFCIYNPHNRRVILSPPFLDKLTANSERFYSV